MFVGAVHGAGQRGRQPGRQPAGQRRPVQVRRQVPALDEFQRKIRAFFRLADVVNLDNVGMAQAGDGRGLGLEPPQTAAIGLVAGQDHFQGDQAAQAELARLVDHTHSSPSQLAQDLVAGQARPARRGRGCGRDR